MTWVVRFLLIACAGIVIAVGGILTECRWGRVALWLGRIAVAVGLIGLFVALWIYAGQA